MQSLRAVAEGRHREKAYNIIISTCYVGTLQIVQVGREKSRGKTFILFIFIF